MIYALIGLISGVISGMGIGGGAVLIPALGFLGVEQRAAQNMNLLYFIPTAVIAIIVHIKKGNIEKAPLKPIVIAGLFSAALGSYIAVNMSGAILRKLFGGFLALIGISEFIKSKQEKENNMDSSSFETMKTEFGAADVNRMVEMYVSAEGLTQEQYRELLKLFPTSQLHLLEAALY